MSWKRGRATIERLIASGELDQITPAPDVADRLLADAGAHIGLAEKGIKADAAGALQLSYDAARKAAVALLAIQGLRATTRGGHIAVLDAAKAQFNDKGGIAVFGRINRVRRRRHDSEYPSADTPAITAGEAQQAITIARETLEAARQIIATGKLGRFE
jgi:hypothetical protein